MRTASLTPYLGFHDCAAAIRFCQKAFGAVETGPRHADADGRIGHETVFVSDEYTDHGARSPKSLGGSHAALHLQVEDAEATARQLAAAGADILRELAEQPDGERRGTFLDPLGYRWMIGQRLETVSKGVLQ